MRTATSTMDLRPPQRALSRTQLLDSGVEVVDRGTTYRGIDDVLTHLVDVRDKEEIEQGSRKLKEIGEVVLVRATFSGQLPTDGFGPSRSGRLELALTFCGDKIVRIERS